MIMSQVTSPARRAADRLWYASAFARYTRKRRAQLGLSVEEAAELSGMKLCDWAAMESGWVPEDHDVTRAVAETLETGWPDLDLLALFASSAQQELHR
jgi:hypothetical protein